MAQTLLNPDGVGQDDPARARQVELILESLDGLPTLTPVATRLLTVSSADDADMAEITKIIESDPALSARILGLCRRADKGLGDKITTVKRAVVMLGLGAVRSAALSVSVFDLMQRPARAAEKPAASGYWGKIGRVPRVEEHQPEESGPTFDRMGFWKYSVGVACAAELLATARPELKVKPDEAFLAGLLHAIGKPALDFTLPRAYARVLLLAERQSSDSAPVERSIIGLDHHTAGRRLAERWGLPVVLQEVMWLHGSTPGALRSLPDTESRPLVIAVTLARAVCRHLHIGWCGDFGAIPDVNALCAELKEVSGRWAGGLKMAEVATSLHAAVSDRLRILGLAEATTPALLMESLAAANQQLGKINERLEDRGREAGTATKALGACSAFLARASRAGSVAEALGEIAHSARDLLGEGFYATIFQARSDEAWHLTQWRGAEPARSEIIEPPGPAHGERSLAALTQGGHLSVGALGLLPWLTDYLADATDLRRVRLVPIAMPGWEREHQPGAAAVLLTDKEWGGGAVQSSIMAAWCAALLAAARHDEARRLGERLALTNRSLAEAQARLTEAESLARLGEMTAGAAHEMNNPLTVISGNAQLLSSRLEELRDRSAAGQIVEACEALHSLVASLHVIATPPAPKPAPCPVVDAVREAIKLAELRAGGATRVRVEDQTQGGKATIDPRLVARAAAELIANALEADAVGETVVRVARDAAGSLVISVIDAGPGFSPRALVHAFDPFFSDKPAGRSHGLGLTRARSLAEAMGGRLTLRNASDRGAIATLTLPA